MSEVTVKPDDSYLAVEKKPLNPTMAEALSQAIEANALKEEEEKDGEKRPR